MDEARKLFGTTGRIMIEIAQTVFWVVWAVASAIVLWLMANNLW